MIGSGWLPLNSHSKLLQTIRSSLGLSALGSRLNEAGVKRVLHQGQFSSGIGEGLPLGLFLKRMTSARAVSWRLSFFSPMILGVAALPTQRPISNGQVP